ncbi:MAG TPA: hypothetical protein VN808_02015 [Stellaceae bacterium]|nr:hypothetical protein [Stellaceae bacterium]
MATLDDIEAQKQMAIAIIQTLIYDATAKANDAQSADRQHQWGIVLNQLNEQRDAVLGQAYEDEPKLPQMQVALDTLEAVTEQLTKVAVRMTGVTAFLNNLADLGGAANQAVMALKKKT